MPTVGMIGHNIGEMAQAFLRLCDTGGDRAPSGDTIQLLRFGENDTPVHVDILVVLNHAPVLARVVPLLGRDDYVLVNGDNKAIFPYLATPAQVITFGFNAKCCITASSVSDGELQVCVQRGFHTLSGRVQEPQEFAAPYPAGMNAVAVLGAVAACTVCESL